MPRYQRSSGTNLYLPMAQLICCLQLHGLRSVSATTFGSRIRLSASPRPAHQTSKSPSLRPTQSQMRYFHLRSWTIFSLQPSRVHRHHAWQIISTSGCAMDRDMSSSLLLTKASSAICELQTRTLGVSGCICTRSHRGKLARGNRETVPSEPRPWDDVKRESKIRKGSRWLSWTNAYLWCCALAAFVPYMDLVKAYLDSTRGHDIPSVVDTCPKA